MSPNPKRNPHLLPGSDSNHILVGALVESHLVLQQNFRSLLHNLSNGKLNWHWFKKIKIQRIAETLKKEGMIEKARGKKSNLKHVHIFVLAAVS